MDWIILAAGIAGLIAVDQWHRHNCRKWAEQENEPDNSLAGAMERSRRHASR